MVSLEAAGRSWFARLFAGDGGIDPYTREVSDVYQDLFGEGSYIGKGIYDVDAFAAATHERFPENLILSPAACQNPSLTYMALTARAANFAVDELNRGNI
jgi:hypothetical protein